MSKPGRRYPLRCPSNIKQSKLGAVTTVRSTESRRKMWKSCSKRAASYYRYVGALWTLFSEVVKVCRLELLLPGGYSKTSTPFANYENVNKAAVWFLLLLLIWSNPFSCLSAAVEANFISEINDAKSQKWRNSKTNVRVPSPPGERCDVCPNFDRYLCLHIAFRRFGPRQIC